MRPDDLEMLEKKPGAVTFTEGEVERAMRKAHGNAKATLRELGIEIVPDPEPALPARPWRVETSERQLTTLPHSAGWFMASVAAPGEGCVIQVLHEDREYFGRAVVALRTLVSAYNAVGERKRIEVVLLDRGVLVNGQLLARAGRNEALGEYIRDHASDLGLEIVEP